MRQRNKVLLGLIVAAGVFWAANSDRFKDPDRIVTLTLGDACIRVPARYVDDYSYWWFTWIYALSPGLDDSSRQQNLSIPVVELAAAIDDYFVLRPSFEINLLVRSMNEVEQAAFADAAWLDDAWSLSGDFEGCKPVYDEKAGLWRLYRGPSCDMYWEFFKERPDPNTEVPEPRREVVAASCYERETDRLPANCDGDYADGNIAVSYDFLLPNIVHVDEIEAFLKSKIKTVCGTSKR